MDNDETSNPGPEQLPGQESEPVSEQPDAAIPELPQDADRNERIRLANLIGRQIAYYVGQKETGTFIAFTADLAIIPRMIALKLCLVRSEDFIQAAKNCHVSKNDAYAIVRLRLDNRIDDIKLDAEIAKRKAEAKGVAFDYPDLKAMIKEYTPPPANDEPPPAGDSTAVADEADDNADGEGANGGTRGGGKSNRTLKDYRRENLHLTETNRLLATKLAMAEAAARIAEEREATLRRDRDAAEQRLAKTEARLAELLRANNNHEPDDPTPDPDPDITLEHGLGGGVDEDGSETPFVPTNNMPLNHLKTDEPYRLENRYRKLDTIKSLEAQSHIKGWRGHRDSSVARQIRADYLAYCGQNDRIPSSHLLVKPPVFWEAQNGVLIDDLIAAYPDDDPPPSPSPEQTPPSPSGHPSEPTPTSPSPADPQQTPPSEPPSDPTPPSPVEEPPNSVYRATNPPVATQPVHLEPDPDPTPSSPDEDPILTLRPIPGERGSPFDAIDEVYHLPIETTCQMVANVLRHYPLDQWDRDDFDRLVEGLAGRAEWSQCAAIAELFVEFDNTDSHKVFCTEGEGVLEYRDGRLDICSWESIEPRIAPALADAKQRHTQRRREQRGRDILRARLPKVRKLKAMKALIDEILTCQPTISDQGQRVIEHIRAMSRDDPQFADCTTFMQYLDKAMEIIEQMQEGPNRSRD